MSKSRDESGEVMLSPAERDHLREGFARLLPTPELEAAVQEIAASVPTASSPWKGRLGLVATLAVAAAVLFALYMPPQNDSAPAGPGEPVEATSTDLVAVAPSYEEVDRARSGNPLPKLRAPSGTPRWHHEGRTNDGGFTITAVDEFLQPFPNMNHRWVVREDDKRFKKPDEYDFGMPPRDGIMLVGAGILNKLGGLASFDKDGALVVRTKNGEWRALPNSATAELEISSPETGGATARIRVGISTAYEGSLVVEGPLARALGLHHFEHPRRALLGGRLRWPAMQSYARIRIPSVGFDETLLVQVRETLGQTKGVLPSPPDTRITIRGVIPKRVAHADQVQFTRDGNFEITDQDEGMTMGLRPEPGSGGVAETIIRIRRSRPMEIALAYDADTPGQPESYVFAGRFDARPDHPIGPGFLTKWCEVSLPNAPGARVTIARVWRGNVAVPSREGVTITWADKNGRVRCPRIVGEASAPLRMRIEPKKGKPFFQMLDLDARTMAVNYEGIGARLTIAPNGAIVMSGKAPENQQSTQTTQAALLDWFKRESAKVPRTDEGSSQLRVHVDADEMTPLSAWLQVLTAAAHPDVHVRQFTLTVRSQRRDAGRTMNYVLPADRGLSPAVPGRTDEPIVIGLSGSLNRAQLNLMGTKIHWEAGGRPQHQAKQLGSLRQGVQRALAAGTRSRLVFRSPRDPSRYPMHAIALMLKALEGLELRSIGFESRR